MVGRSKVRVITGSSSRERPCTPRLLACFITASSELSKASIWAAAGSEAWAIAAAGRAEARMAAARTAELRLIS